MQMEFLSVLFLGFILGIKHALEPDHVIAVSTIASGSKSLRRSSLAGVFWGIGHTATLFMVGLILIIMKVAIPEKWAMSLEFLVGIMLVYLGVNSLLSMRVKQKDSPQRHNHERSYWRSLIIGFIHGLAGSAAMVLLTMSTVQTVWEGAIYIAIFGIGTVVGMLAFTSLIGLPFVLSAKNEGLNHRLTQIAGGVSAVFGFYYMYNLGITEGLFKLWIE